MSLPLNRPNRAVKTTTSSAVVPGGFWRRDTSTGLAGSRTSTTATPLLGGRGQNRSLPVAQSVNPQCPT